MLVVMRASVTIKDDQHMIAYCNDITLLSMHFGCGHATNKMHVESWTSMAPTLSIISSWAGAHWHTSFSVLVNYIQCRNERHTQVR